MTSSCRLCGSTLTQAHQAADAAIASHLCAACLSHVSGAKSPDVLEAIDAPILLMQGNPRQVVRGNTQALRMFAKPQDQIDGHRGGQVFDCVHSFTVAGCGKDINCEPCVIRKAIVDTFETGVSHQAVSSTLPVRKANGEGERALQVSTQKVGDLALVRIERYDAI